MTKRFLFLLTACLLALTLPAQADDWPQWRGPNRDDVSKETGLLKEWPKDGPKLLWTFKDAGTGYSGPAIVGDRLYTMGADAKSDTLYALDTRTGERLWSTEIGPRTSLDRGDGPRGTPTVDGDRLYALGSQGELACLEIAGGKKVWSVNLIKDLGGSRPKWGYSESPLVDEDKVICTPGGSKGTLAALDKKSGAVVWRSKDLKDGAHYSSVIVATVGGVRQYVQTTNRNVVGVAAKDGRLLWQKSEAVNGVATIPTPIFHDDQVYASSGYGAGCVLLKLNADGDRVSAEKVYANKNMVNHHGGVVLVGDYLYGYSDGKGWVCQNFKTGEISWSDKTLGKGAVTCADGRLYCFGQDDGKVVLIEATPSGWKEHGRFPIPQKTRERPRGSAIWTHPVVANGRFYLRDHEFIFCYDVKAGSTGGQ
jgi:outer membrane protein assembly factor BamB